jgi:predicted anti-sigma-YlaC factor YlaD
MKCLRIDQIYLYLEGELSSEDAQSIQEHISSCPKCKKAVEERRLLVKASKALPSLEIPPDFTQRVLAQIFPKTTSVRGWLTTAVLGLSSAVLAFFAVYLLSGQNLPHLLINLNNMTLNLFRNFIVVLVKTAKLISLVMKIFLEIGSMLFKGLANLTTILNPETQIILIVLTVILSALLLYGAKRKFFAGEKA